MREIQCRQWAFVDNMMMEIPHKWTTAAIVQIFLPLAHVGLGLFPCSLSAIFYEYAERRFVSCSKCDRLSKGVGGIRGDASVPRRVLVGAKRFALVLVSDPLGIQRLTSRQFAYALGQRLTVLVAPRNEGCKSLHVYPYVLEKGLSHEAAEHLQACPSSTLWARHEAANAAVAAAFASHKLLYSRDPTAAFSRYFKVNSFTERAGADGLVQTRQGLVA